MTCDGDEEDPTTRSRDDASRGGEGAARGGRGWTVTDEIRAHRAFGDPRRGDSVDDNEGMGRRDEGARRGVAERGERDAGEALADDQVMRAL
jgi:hypothetical protein